jgi:hypothetical protein
VTASNKVYDGTTTASISGVSLVGAIAGDDVHLTVGPANFASPNVGTWTVTATGLGLAGAAAGNYVLASNTALTTASITAKTTTSTTPLEAVLRTAEVINVTHDGCITFKFSHVQGIVDGQTVAQLFGGVQFSLKIGSTLFSGTSTARVVEGSIFVSWQVNHALRADLETLLNGTRPGAKTTVDLTVYATSRDGKYTLSEVVETRIFRPGHEHHHKVAHHSHDGDKDKR